MLNRSVGAGTFGLRRSMFHAIGGYDGDVLFENLELVRTVRVRGRTEVRPPSLFVRRLPPSARRFWSQRVRQAFDDLTQPWRHGLFLVLLPVLAVLVTDDASRTGDRGEQPRACGHHALLYGGRTVQFRLGSRREPLVHDECAALRRSGLTAGS